MIAKLDCSKEISDVVKKVEKGIFSRSYEIAKAPSSVPKNLSYLSLRKDTNIDALALGIPQATYNKSYETKSTALVHGKKQYHLQTKYCFNMGT